MSVPQMPQAATLIRTSPVATSGTGTSSTRTMPFSRKTPARMVLGIGPRDCDVSSVLLAWLICSQPLEVPAGASHANSAKVSSQTLPESARELPRRSCCPFPGELEQATVADGAPLGVWHYRY